MSVPRQIESPKSKNDKDGGRSFSLKRMKSLNYLTTMKVGEEEARRKRGEKRGWSRRGRGRKDGILVTNLFEKKKKQFFLLELEG